MNEGKKFEQCWKNSVPKHCFYHKLKDPAQSFNKDENNLRFSPNNPCDAFMFDDNTRTFYALELKSTQGTSFSFWREDFEDKSKKQTFMIKKNQIKGLLSISAHQVVCGFIFNFRKTKHTYFQMIDDFILMTKDTKKKSVNENDIQNNNAILIGQELMRTNYKYDVEGFLRETSL